jgi:hypothetical protein
VWLPPLFAFVLSPLSECAHCMRLYAALYPLAPGVGAGLAAAPAGSGSNAVLWIAAPATVGLWWATRAGLAARTRSVRAWTVALATLCSGASSVALGHLLRM